MKKDKTAKKIEGLTISVIFLSIVGLILISFLPWVSVTEEDWIKEDLYFNFEMMKKSDNENITSLANELDLISLLYWGLIIIGFLVLIVILMHAFVKTIPTVILLLIIGLAVLIISILVFYLQFTFVRNIEGIDSISLATLIPFFYYAYIPLILSLVLLIISVRHTVVVSLYSLKKFSEYKKQKKESGKEKPEKKKSRKIQKKESETKDEGKTKQEKTILKKTPLELEQDKKRIEMEQWITSEIKGMEKQKKPEKQVEPEKSGNVKDKSGPFISDETKEKTEETYEELPVSQSFEEALSSAIQKRQDGNNKIPSEEDKKTEIKTGEPPEIKEEKNPEKEGKTDKITFKVRCPKCRCIFVAEKGIGVTKIKCPNCGKEGNIK